MSGRCWANGCEHRLGDACKFYKFPAKPEQKDKWKNLAEQEKEPGEDALLCSCHLSSGEPADTSNFTCKDLLNSLEIDVERASDGEARGLQVHVVSSQSQGHEINTNVSKRLDYIDWEEYFMATALLAAKRSKDPVTQVGACLVNKDKIIVGVGYNGMPKGCDDDMFPWGKSPDLLHSKHAYVCHAELNAVLNTNSKDLSDCTLYVVLFPCNECAKVIIQAKIKDLIYLSDKHAAKSAYIAAKNMFRAAGVNYRRFEPRRSQIVISFEHA